MGDGEKWTCASCGTECAPHQGDGPQTPCESCGSVARNIELHFHDVMEVKVSDWLEVKAKDVTLPSKKKLRRHLQIGSQWSVGRGKLVDKVRDLDKDADMYLERVVDPDTGEVIRHCEEPLSEHVGRGSAKAKDK